jgi:hypothetical protein
MLSRPSSSSLGGCWSAHALLALALAAPPPGSDALRLFWDLLIIAELRFRTTRLVRRKRFDDRPITVCCGEVPTLPASVDGLGCIIERK